MRKVVAIALLSVTAALLAAPAWAGPTRKDWHIEAEAVCTHFKRSVFTALGQQRPAVGPRALQLNARRAIGTLARLSLRTDDALGKLTLPKGQQAALRRALASDRRGAHVALRFAATLGGYRTIAAYKAATRRFQRTYDRAERPWTSFTRSARLQACET